MSIRVQSLARCAVILLTLALGTFGAAASAEANVTVKGKMTAYHPDARPWNPMEGSGPDVAGRKVTVTAWSNTQDKDHRGCTVCVPRDDYYSATVEATTSPKGDYSVPLPFNGSSCSVAAHVNAVGEACPAQTRKAWVTVTSTMHEAPVVRELTNDGIEVTVDLPFSPEILGAAGGYWARRVGSGTYPLVVIEGIDPTDEGKSDAAVLRMRISKTTDDAVTQDVLQYLIEHGFTVWFLQSGPHGADSIAGRSGTGSYEVVYDKEGMAYKAMRLISDIRKTRHPNARIAVGGYSMGGVVARSGLHKWCGGQWKQGTTLPARSSNPWVVADALTEGCPEVGLAWFGDAPLEGANVPVSIQRVLRDPEFSDFFTAEVNQLKHAFLDAWGSREMARRTVPKQLVNYSYQDSCDTDMESKVDTLGSTDPRFYWGCSATTADADKFRKWHFGGADLPWQAALPVRSTNGKRLPAVAFSVGGDPAGPPVCDAAPRWLRIRVDNWLDKGLGPNSGLSCTPHPLTGECAKTPELAECVPGSKLTFAKPLHRTELKPVDIFGLGDQVTLVMEQYPTFIPTTSSLHWADRNTAWKDYWVNDTNAQHMEMKDCPLGSSAPAGSGLSSKYYGTDPTRVRVLLPGTPPEKFACEKATFSEWVAPGEIRCPDGARSAEVGAQCKQPKLYLDDGFPAGAGGFLVGWVETALKGAPEVASDLDSFPAPTCGAPYLVTGERGVCKAVVGDGICNGSESYLDSYDCPGYGTGGAGGLTYCQSIGEVDCDDGSCSTGGTCWGSDGGY